MVCMVFVVYALLVFYDNDKQSGITCVYFFSDNLDSNACYFCLRPIALWGLSYTYFPYVVFQKKMLICASYTTGDSVWNIYEGIA